MNKTLIKATNKWKRTGGGNSILEGKNFYISYNSNPGMGLWLFASDNHSDETALCKDNEFYILNGDFKKEYEKLINKGFAACKRFYEQKKEEFGSSWSN